MRHVDRPQFDPEEVFVACIGHIQEQGLKSRLEEIAGYVASESATYADRAAVAELHLVPSATDVDGTVTTDEMVALYDQRMAGKKGPARHIYDAIRLLPNQGICPLCDHRPVMTLDHLLPKRLFPALSVTPDNLIGACGDCNKMKLAFAPTAAEDVFLHPYFDNVEGGRWLGAQVVEGSVAALLFRTQSVAEWSDALDERVRRQFKMLGLASLYGAQAAREISAQALLLGKIHDSRGSDGVRSELKDQVETREAVNLNSWQAVTYRVLSESDWFCHGGFRCT